MEIDNELQAKIVNKTIGPYLLEKLEEELEISNELEFSLLINDTITKFYLSKVNSSQNKDNISNKFLFFATYNGELYYTKNQVYEYDKNSKIFTFKNFDKDWVISDESKLINGYKCYKATRINVVINPKGKFEFPVVAWFCPELPYNYGPIGFCGLPGLIMQLKYKITTYQVKQINFDDKSKFTFDKFINTPKLSIEEHEANILAKHKQKDFDID